MERNKLNFNFEWQEISDFKINGPELVATWATMSIFFGADSVSQMVDKKSDTIKDSLNLPLYPLAEWIALNWWHLLYEPFTPNKIDLSEYNRRHNFSFAREGYALPNLSIKPMGDIVLLEWRRAKLFNHKIEFIDSGQGKMSLDALKEDLYDFVDKIVNRLDIKGISGTLLQEEWDSIQSLDREETKFCKTAASAGLDPFNISESQVEILTKIYSELPPEVVDDFFTSCNPDNLEWEAEQTIKAIKEIESSDFYVEKLSSLRKRIQHHPFSNSLPWNEGYEAARQLRNELNLNGDVFESINDIGKAFRISVDESQGIMNYRDLPKSVSVISGVNERESPYFVIANTNANPRKDKFAYCRAIYDYLFSIDSRISLITKTHVESQKRNRAFAAEFLVPAEKLRKFVPHGIVTEEEIQDLADVFFVDPIIIRHQIENHKISKIEYLDQY